MQRLMKEAKEDAKRKPIRAPVLNFEVVIMRDEDTDQFYNYTYVTGWENINVHWLNQIDIESMGEPGNYENWFVDFGEGSNSCKHQILAPSPLTQKDDKSSILKYEQIFKEKYDVTKFAEAYVKNFSFQTKKDRSNWH